MAVLFTWLYSFYVVSLEPRQELKPFSCKCRGERGNVWNEMCAIVGGFRPLVPPPPSIEHLSSKRENPGKKNMEEIVKSWENEGSKIKRRKIRNISPYAGRGGIIIQGRAMPPEFAPGPRLGKHALIFYRIGKKLLWLLLPYLLVIIGW